MIKYRLLKPDEIIQKDDMYLSPDGSWRSLDYWAQVNVAKMENSNKGYKFYRPKKPKYTNEEVIDG
jgi:hypothetical protein